MGRAPISSFIAKNGQTYHWQAEFCIKQGVVDEHALCEMIVALTLDFDVQADFRPAQGMAAQYAVGVARAIGREDAVRRLVQFGVEDGNWMCEIQPGSDSRETKPQELLEHAIERAFPGAIELVGFLKGSGLGVHARLSARGEPGSPRTAPI